MGDQHHVVEATRRTDKGHQIQFAGVTDRAGAEAIRGKAVSVAERRALAADEFWPENLIGLEVRPGGGEIVDVAHGPAQARLVVERAGERFEVPFVTELVPVVDPEAGYVEITEIPGLIAPSDE